MKRLIALLFCFPAFAAFPTVNGTQGSQTSTAGTSHTIQLGATPTTGDMLIVIASFGLDAGALTWPSGFGTWTQLTNTVNTSHHQVIVYKSANGEGTSISVTSTNSARMASIAIRIAASSYTGNPEAGTPATGNSTAPNPPAATPSWGTQDVTWLAIAGQRSQNAVTTYPTNYTSNNLTQASGGSGAAVSSTYLASRNLNGSTANPGTYALAGSGGAWVANTVAVQGTGGAPPATPKRLTTLGIGAANRPPSLNRWLRAWLEPVRAQASR